MEMQPCLFCIAKFGFVLIMFSYLAMELIEICAPGETWYDLLANHRKRRGYE